MEKLTDIKHPWRHQRAAQKPPRESWIKRFLKWCWQIITAPFRLIWSLLRSVWIFFVNLILKIKAAISAFFSTIFSAVSGFFLTLRNAAVFILRAFKNFLLSLWPRNQASWIVLLLALIFLWQVLTSLEFPLVDSKKWQAVSLSNTQIYFGHLKEISGKYALLKDAYYLQAPSGTQTTTNLVRLEEKLYGPENQIYIPKEQIVFWENLQENSQVVRAIEQINNR